MTHKAHQIKDFWLSLVTDTSGYIEQKKRALMKEGPIYTFLDIIMVILSEIFLAVVSLPLYLSRGGHRLDRREEGQFQVRRLLTLAILLPLVIVWGVKLIIVGFSVYVNTQDVIDINENSASKSGIEYKAAEISAAPINEAIPAPTILQVGNNIVVQGASYPNSEIAVYLSHIGPEEKDSTLTTYLLKSDAQGQWELSKRKSEFFLEPGIYTVNALVYNTSAREKSFASPIVEFTVKESLFYKIIYAVDNWLNVFLIAFLSISAFFAFLTYRLRR